MATAEVALRCPAEVSADNINFMWWLKCFASIGVLTLFWIATRIISHLQSLLSGGQPKSKIVTVTVHKSVQGPVTYHTTPSASRYNVLAEHAWGAW